MSVHLILDAINTDVGNSSRKLVLIKLADNASDSGVCWPSYSYLARQCEMSSRSVMRHVKELAKIGLITIEHRRDEIDSNQSNLFTMHLRSSLHNKSHDKKTKTASEKSAPPSDTVSPPLVTQCHPEPVNLEPIKKIYKKDSHFSKFDFTTLPENITTAQAEDYINYRKSIKAPLKTQRGFLARMNELAKSAEHGYTVDQAIDLCKSHEWRGFESSWLANIKSTNKSSAAQQDAQINWMDAIYDDPFLPDSVLKQLPPREHYKTH